MGLVEPCGDCRRGARPLWAGRRGAVRSRSAPSSPSGSSSSFARTVEITARDGIALRAWFFTPPTPNGNALLILHGIADSRASQAGLAGMFLEHGYTVLVPDSRAHGDSGGALATHGLLEADDVHRWVSWLIEIRIPAISSVWASRSVGPCCSSRSRSNLGSAPSSPIARSLASNESRSIALRKGFLFHLESAGDWPRLRFGPDSSTRVCATAWTFALLRQRPRWPDPGRLCS